MDKFERHRDRYSNTGEEPHHHSSSGRRGFSSSRFSDDGSPFSEHPRENYRGGGGGGGVGGRSSSPRSYRSGEGGDGGREPRRPFDSPPRYPPPPTGGEAGRGMRPIGDGVVGLPPMGGGGGFRPMVGGRGGGFRPMGGDDGGFGPMGGDGGELWPMRGCGDGGGFRPVGGRGDDGGGFRPVGGRGGDGGGFRPVGGRGGDGGGFGLDNYSMPAPPLSGQKRGYPFSGRERSPDRFDSTGFAKLFVGSVPRTATEADIRPLFDKHGHVLEVALIKDKRTGQQQGCCFVKYASSEDADRAIRALHNQYTLPGGVGPIQVRYADGERERLGATEYKLFVGSLNRQATEKEVEEIFLPYGRVEDVYLMRDEMKQSRGCGFVKYSQREMAQAAINALNGTYTMRGCDQPLTVRFADPKRPRPGERGGPVPGFGPRSFAPGIRPPLDAVEPLRGPIPLNSWPLMSPPNLGPPSNVGIHGFSDQLPGRSGDTGISSIPGQLGGLPGNADGSLPGPPFSSAPMTQNFSQPLPQVPPYGSKISPSQRPLQSPQNMPSSLQLKPPNAAPYSNVESLQGSHMQSGQVQAPHSAGQNHYNQVPPPQQLPGLNGQISVSQSQLQHNAMPSPGLGRGGVNQQRQPAQQLQPHHQSPSQLAQMLSQQKETLQATFQSSQQAFNQLQQQLQQLQPSNQNLIHQGPHSVKQQSPWVGITAQSAATTPAVQPADLSRTTTASSTVPAAATVNCNWTEHTAPDGYKYYYNSSTGESKWEKPEELAQYDRQQQAQQKPSNQHPQVQSQSQPQPQGQSTQHAPQVQLQGQHQTHLQNQIRPFQQPSQSLMYQSGLSTKQGTKELGYAPVSTATVPANDPAYYQQGLQHSQEWMWKNKPSGN